MTLGFIGTGTLTAAVVAGLRTSGVRERIVLSARSETVSMALAAQFENVLCSTSNRSVADQSDIVLLAVRPAQVETALDGVVFRAGQLLVSFVTGLSVKELADLAPEASVCRVLPLPMIQRCKGPIVCFPAEPRAVEVFSGLGDLICAASEDDLQAFGRVSAFMSSFFELQRSLKEYLEDLSVTPAEASFYVRSMMAGLADTALRTPTDGQDALPAEHETSGGLNERIRRTLQDRGWFDEPGSAFDRLTGIDRKSLE